MTDPTESAYRSLFDPPADVVALRDADEVEDEDGMMEIRMPIASTGAVRNEGDDPLSASELHGMAQQVDSLSRGVFPEHGHSDAVDAGVYSQFEKLGYWSDADLQSEASDDGEDLLMATARMPDPETLPAATGDYREALAILKEQAKRGIPISASIGWRDDDAYPGGVDLMEASIVGIGADPRTNTDGGTEALARAAIDAGADPDDLVAAVRRAVDRDMTDDDDPGADAGTTDGEQDLSIERAINENRSLGDLVEKHGAETVAEEFREWHRWLKRDADDDGTERSDEQEFREFMREQQEQLTELLRALVESREGDKDDDDDEDGDDDDEEDDDNEQSADDTDGDRDADGDEYDERLAELEAELEALRSGDTEVQTPDADTDDEQSADTDESDETSDRDAESPTDGLGDYR